MAIRKEIRMIEWITQIDYSILLFIQEHLRFDWLTGPLVFISHLGNSGWFWIALCILLLIPKRTRAIGLCGLIALLIGALITNVCLKNWVARIRPYEQFADLKLLLETQRDFSFPSGHACSSFAAAYAIYHIADKPMKKLGIFSLILASVIAWSRLYVAVHFPTDVLGGILIGLLSGWLACLVYKKYLKDKLKKICWNETEVSDNNG